MTFRQFILLVIIAVTVSLLMVFMTRSAEPCQTPEQVAALVAADGATITGAAYYRGQMTDSLLVVETDTAIVLYGFKDGCMVAMMALEPREPVTPA